MSEAQSVGVKSEASDGVCAVAVFSVSDDRKTEVLHVNPYLIFASGLQLQFHKAESVRHFEDVVMRYREFSAVVFFARNRQEMAVFPQI